MLVPDQLNTYDVLCADDVVFTEGSLSTFLAGPTKGSAVQVDVEDAAVAEPAKAKAEPATTGSVSAEAADESEDTK